MKVKALHCPNCGANVQIRNNFCSRCGSALVFEDDVVKIKPGITHRSIDVA